MGAQTVLQDPDVCTSVAWSAVKQMFGIQVRLWEPTVFHIELERRHVEVTDGLMAKILAAQTIATGCEWAYDHSILFAFSLACDGIPITNEDVTQPTVEQLAWAMAEINVIVEKPCTEDEGPDPDEVDAAISVVLREEGFVVPPVELAFVKDVLTGLTPGNEELRGDVEKYWAVVDQFPLERGKVAVARSPETPVGVHLRRLMDVKTYVHERSEVRARQNVTLTDR